MKRKKVFWLAFLIGMGILGFVNYAQCQDQGRHFTSTGERVYYTGIGGKCPKPI